MKQRLLFLIASVLPVSLVCTAQISEAEAIEKPEMLMLENNFLTKTDSCSGKRMSPNLQTSVDNSISVQVDGGVTLSLTKGVDYNCNTAVLKTTWSASNSYVSLREIGAVGRRCRVLGEIEGKSEVTCTYYEPTFNEETKEWEIGESKTKTWEITISGFYNNPGGDENNDDKSIVHFVHPDLHLYIEADTEDELATIVSNGINISEGNSLVTPYDGDNLDKTNYWKNLVIPSTIEYAGKEYGVVGIGPYAFNKALQIETITLPETILSIGTGAFNWCVNLKSVNIPSLVNNIPSSCFTYCRELEKMHLPKGIEYIGAAAFSDCKKLTEINIPGKCNEIGAEAFTWCRALTKLTIEDSENTLHLSYSQNLGVDYEIGAEWYIEPIIRGQFVDCPITQLYLGRNISFPDGSAKISYLPFQRLQLTGYNSGGKPVYSRVGKEYTSLEFGDKVTNIQDNLFGGANISKLVMPNNVETIGSGAFAGTVDGNSLQQVSITLPKSLISIGADAFNNSGLRFVTCESVVPPELLSPNVFNTSNYHDGNMRGYKAVIIVPEGTANAYRKKENWGNYIVKAPDDELLTINVRTPGSLYSRLLAQDVQLNEVYRLKLKGTLNNDDWSILGSMNNLYEYDLSELNVEELPDKIFYQNTSLVDLRLPNTLKEIGDSAFFSCEHLKGVVKIPSACSTIGKYAFFNTGIEGLDYVGNIHIKDFAFRYCGNIEELNLEGEGTIVETWAFNATSIKELTIGRGVTINKEVFFYCNNLSEITFKDGVEKIGEGAFSACYNIKKVTFEGLINNVEGDPWEHDKEGPNLDYLCINDVGKWLRNPWTYLTSKTKNFLLSGEEITEVTIPEDVTEIVEDAFYNCKKLGTINFHDGITSIGDNAFYGCAVRELVLPKSLTQILFNAFGNCENIASIDIPESVEVFMDPFDNCPNLQKVVAHWENPISGSLFIGSHPDCYLYVPIGTATKYSLAGWGPNIKEVGIMNIVATNGGRVIYSEEAIENDTKEFFFTPYKSFTLSFEPHEGYSLWKVMVNNVNRTSEVENCKLFIEEPEENIFIRVEFADDSIETGDVNGDGVVNVTDAIGVVNYILKNTPSSFVEGAADVNQDGIINITDAIGVVNMILGNGSSPRMIRANTNEPQ